ncbi:MAG: phytanoyl-CoA dioxygenase family protein [Boseongicola sp. SB0676_bin_33]|nr:phytanoyl-CoA dioxygenase family protein [Boseongicola sp. SB0676_bin_33]
MLSRQDVDSFWRQGYLVVEGLVDDHVLGNVRDEYAVLMDRLFNQWHMEGLVDAPRPGMDFWDKLDVAYRGGFDWYQPVDISLPFAGITEETPFPFGPAVFDMVTDRNILDAVETLIGPEITSNPIQHVRIKPPERAVAKDEIRAHVVSTDWHQDQGVTLPEADQTEFVTVWLAITDATVENGCLKVAAERYDEMMPHCPRVQTALAGPYVPKTSMPVPVKAGGAVIFHPMTPHASLANESDGYRWSFDLRYSVTGQPTGRSHFPEFVARSRGNPASELKDWRVWNAMWEEARRRLANSPHIAQHRWDESSPHCA